MKEENKEIQKNEMCQKIVDSINEEAKENPETTKLKTWAVNVDYIHGQSFYPRKIFEGSYYASVNKIDEIVDSISEILKTPYFGTDLGETIFVESNDEEMKLKLLSAIMKKQPSYSVSIAKNNPGSDFGWNISTNLVEKEVRIF